MSFYEIKSAADIVLLDGLRWFEDGGVCALEQLDAGRTRPRDLTRELRKELRSIASLGRVDRDVARRLCNATGRSIALACYGDAESTAVALDETANDLYETVSSLVSLGVDRGAMSGNVARQLRTVDAAGRSGIHRGDHFDALFVAAATAVAIVYFDEFCRS